MTYEEGMASVPPEFTNDPLWRMEVFRLAVFASDLAWHDVSRLAQDKRTVSLSDQMYRAVCSISANFSEGYSRRSGKDQARFYEYSLGSAREARVWYYQGRFVLTEAVAMHRITLMTKIIRLLLNASSYPHNWPRRHQHNRHDRHCRADTPHTHRADYERL